VRNILIFAKIESGNFNRKSTQEKRKLIGNEERRREKAQAPCSAQDMISKIFFHKQLDR